MAFDREDSPTYRLKVPAGRFEQDLVKLIVLIQFTMGLMAILMFGFWIWLVIGSWYHPWMFKPGMFWEYFSIDWHPSVFALAVLFAITVVLMHYLYETE